MQKAQYKLKILKRTIVLLLGLTFPMLASSQITPRFIKDPMAKTGTQNLHELIRRTLGLYNLRPNFEGLSETELVKASVVPSGLLKWGQIKNPVGEGFLSVSALSLPDKEKEAPDMLMDIWMPFVPLKECLVTLAEVSMMPEVSEIQVGQRMPRFPNGVNFNEKQLQEVCSYLDKEGLHVISRFPRMGQLTLKERKVKPLDEKKPLFDLEKK